MARHIYVHIPFCIRKCDYCDFYSISCMDNERIEKYFDALLKEIELVPVIEDTNDDLVDTIYFGGGTPSVPDSKLIGKVLASIMAKFDITSDAEITIECNPASVTLEKFIDYRNAGFNRVSIGIQSLNDDTLKVLGRLHDRKRAMEAIKEAGEAGFENVSADLMIGIPGQTLDEVLDNGNTLISLGVNHVSMYSLIIEEGTKFFEKYGETLDSYISQDLEREMYHRLRNLLNESGIKPYEISNCGKSSIHNMSYWRGYEYYAFGPASSGYLDGKRFTHIPDVKEYSDALLDNDFDIEKIVELDEELTKKDRMSEYIMLMFRTTEGVSNLIFRKRFGEDMEHVFEKELNNLLEKKLITKNDECYSLTEKGLDYANEVFREFV